MTTKEFARLIIRGEVEDTKLEAQAKNTKKFEAKNSPSENRPSPSQGQECSRSRTKDTGGSILQKKKFFKNFFQAISRLGKQKRSSKIFREVSGVFQNIFAVQKIGNFRGLDVSRPRTSKCVIEDSTSAYYPEKPIQHSLLNSALQLFSFIPSRSTTLWRSTF